MSHYNHTVHSPPSPPPEPETYYQKPLVQQQQQQQKRKLLLSKWIVVLQKLLKELDGRDKLMKIIQYFIKILLHYNIAKAKHWSTLTSHFSMTRKLLRLGNGIGPLRELSPFTQSVPSTLIALNAIVNHISDDVFCLYKLGLVGSYLGAKSERISAYCWFAGILVDLRESAASLHRLQNSPVKENEDEKRVELCQKIFVNEISIIKLLMDAVFCACDIWTPKHSASIQAWSGFLSGSLAGYKLWIKFSA